MPGTQDLTPEERQQLDDVFSYHPPRPDQIPKYQQVREAGKYFAAVILASCPAGPDRTAALRKIREAVCTANMAIALEGRAIR